MRSGGTGSRERRGLCHAEVCTDGSKQTADTLGCGGDGFGVRVIPRGEAGGGLSGTAFGWDYGDGEVSVSCFGSGGGETETFPVTQVEADC